MRKCPVCDKTFDDSMRFCQTDGTPLVDMVEGAQSEDPYKTMVAGKDDIASAIPPLDPFKTMVAGSTPSKKENEDDLLQLPGEEKGFDPMKTMVVQPIKGSSDASAPAGEVKNDSLFEKTAPPLSPFDSFNSPPSTSQPVENQNDFSSPIPSFSPTPDPPKYSETSLNPPSFGNPPSEPLNNFNNQYSSGSAQDDKTFALDSASLENKISEEPPATMLGGDSPFGKPSSAPIPSPFGETPKSPFENTPPPFPSYKEPEPVKSSFSPSSFNQPENLNQPLQQQSWNPPPAPDANWQNQGVGQNTPFQPPPAGVGLNQTLPIVSLVFGILSICCYIAPITGLVALITGYMGIKNINTNPNEFGGKGLAIAGMIVGGVFLLLGVLYWLYVILVVGTVGLGILGNM